MILLMTTAAPTKGPWIHGRGFPPLGLAYVASALEKEGFQVQILDNYSLNNSIEHVKSEIGKLRPEIVGIACSSVTYRRCIETAQAVKEVLPSCKVVVGGPHPSFEPESLLQCPEIDFVVSGEGELAMVELARYIRKGKCPSDLVEIPNISYRREGKIVKNAPLLIGDLDQIPFPARHLLPMDLYDRSIEYLDVRPVDTMHVIRGCPFNCLYCESRGIWGKRCRAFSPLRVVQEIDHLVSDFGTKGVYFVEDNFTIQKKWTVKLCNLLKKQKLDIEWVCDTRVDLVSRELLKVMKDAGCKTIFFGVQSGSPRILEKINKGITRQQVVDAFKLCKDEGIQIASTFMLGIPGETIGDMEASLRFAKELDPDWCRFDIFIAVPGSGLYDEVMQNGLYDRVEDFVVYVKTEEFNYESISEIQRRFQKSFHRSPKRILKKIRKSFLPNLSKNLRLSANN